MKVWLSRPDVLETAQKIIKMCATPIIAPVSEIKKYWIPEYKNIDTIILTSSNAIPADMFHTCDFITVGQKSANILINKGMRLRASFNTVDELIKSLKRLDNTRSLYLRGEHITRDIKYEIGCHEHITYSANERNLNDAEILEIKNADCVLIYSKRSGLLLNHAMFKYGINSEKMHAIYISKNAFDIDSRVKFKSVLTANDPTESSMLDKLKFLINNGRGEIK